MPSDPNRDAKVAGDLASLATDPRFDLHDSRFREVTLDRTARAITMALDCGDRVVGYRRLTLTFEEAKVVPDNLSRLADAVGAEFRANHWHQRRTVTEIQKHEIRVLPGGRYALRLQLWPFYEFSIEFSGFSLVEVPMSSRGPARAGRFTVSA